MRLKRLDLILISGLIATSSVLLIFNFSRPAGGMALALIGNDNRQILDLSIDSVYIFQGRISPVVITVRDNAVRVSESGCPLQLCIHRGKISRVGESIVCLPNRLAVYIVKGKPRIVDAIAG